MSSVGKASLTIVPKFDNLGKSVTKALNGVDTTVSGTKAGQGFATGFEKGTGGFFKSGAAIGIFSAATTKAMDMISASVGGAISRLDTLNNYPRVMQSLGYSAEESEASIAKMSEHLTGLPTALNDMSSTVQGISAITGDLTLATDAGLALNDMLLASGSNTAVVNSAMEQFRQMLSKGKPDMQDWKSLVSAMPGQMNQLAQSLLGPTANANDLYAALGGGGAEATISMDELMRKMVEMDTVGSGSFTSFSDQARAATGGIQSSMANMQTAIERGVASIFESIGTDTISDTLSGVGKAFESGLGIVGDVIETVKPAVSGFVDLLGRLGPATVPAIAGIVGLAGAGKGLNGLASVVGNASNAFAGIKGVAKGASESLLTIAASMKNGSKASEGLLKMSGALGGAMGGPLVAGITAAVVAGGFLVAALMDAKKKSDDFKGATTGLADAVKATSAPITAATDAYSSLSNVAGNSAKSVREINDSINAAAEAQSKLSGSIEERNSTMSSSVGLLETYKNTISEYANQTGLDAQAQQELKFAIDQVNEACGTQYSVVDAANGVIADQNGEILTNTDAINDNIEAKQRQLKVEALSENYKDVYKQQYADLQLLNDARATQAVAQDNYNKALEMGLDVSKHFGPALDEANDAVSRAEQVYNGANDALDELTNAMTEASSGTDVIKLALESMGDVAITAIQGTGKSVDEFSAELANAGISASDLENVSSEHFAQMLNSCGGDITSLTSMIELYNSVPVIDKDGNVNIEDSKLMDAQGNIYTWNEGILYDKNGVAAINDTSLVDAQGNTWVWNGTGLDSKGAIAVVTGNAADGTAEGKVLDADVAIDSLSSKEASVNVNGNYVSAGASIWDLGSSIKNLASKTVDVVTNFFTNGTKPNAAGGIRPHADGGYRLHAAGAIATKAMPLDIVGEDGAEAIVPLTNKKYSLPFAKTIAEQMGGVGSTTNYNLYLNDLVVNDDEAIREKAYALIKELIRKGRT